jgi:hypothetical protein
MRGKSQKKGVAYVTFKDSALPAPPVRGPPMRPWEPTMTEPESLGAEKAPDLGSWGGMAYTIEV